MGEIFESWRSRSSQRPQTLGQLKSILIANRDFHAVERLEYGDHGLTDAYERILDAIRSNKKIALYADYDVDGTMSCVSWIWFLRAIGYENFVYYIPDRFAEGYGVNLGAVQKLAGEFGAELIITMDTGITANLEAEWCRDNGIDFICTDHHKVQPEKMPDCTILNPKLHPDPLYQELCGCGITFVLLRKLGAVLTPPDSVWPDILALTGMATICDVVPLNGVNHRLARYGADALLRSRRPVLESLRQAAAIHDRLDEKDVGFRLGPRINAVGRLEHAGKVVRAFIDEDPDELVDEMGRCNEKRKRIQAGIVDEAESLAREYPDDPVLFLGGDWHPGVVGIAASKIAEKFWRPTWLFQRDGEQCKGSARSIPGFDVTEAMMQAGELFSKFGGHAAAGGFSFPTENEAKIREALCGIGATASQNNPDLWTSKVFFDCALPLDLLDLGLADTMDGLKPFGHGFAEPSFSIESRINDVVHYKDKATGKPKHTALTIEGAGGAPQKLMFFNRVVTEAGVGDAYRFVVTAARNTWRGRTSLSLTGVDLAPAEG